MAFDALQKLGEEKFRQVTNDLIRGVSCMSVARKIQSEWGDFEGVAEKTLTQQLTRYKATLAGTPEAIEAQAGGRINIKLLRGSNVCVLSELSALHEVQKRRIEMLANKEAELKMPMAGLSSLIMDDVELLEKMQKIRFDLGQDAYHGVQSGMRAGMERTVNPDGSTSEKIMVEAYSRAQEILDSRGIAAPTLEG